MNCNDCCSDPCQCSPFGGKTTVYERIRPALEAQRQARTTHWRCCNIQCGASYNEAKERCDSCGNMVYAVGGIA